MKEYYYSDEMRFFFEIEDGYLLSSFGIYNQRDSIGRFYRVSEGHITGEINGTDSIYHGGSNWYSYNSDGIRYLTSEKQFQNGIQIGEYKTFYPNGQISLIGQYSKYGLAEGVWYGFWPNGDIAEVINFSEGKKNGFMMRYLEDGKMWIKENYLNDVVIESWKY